MLNVEFFKHLERLEKTFNKSHFSSERADIIYSAVRDLDSQWFKQLVDKIISSQRQPPMPNDFIEAAHKERGRRFDANVQQSAAKWDSGEFNGLRKYLDSIGAYDLKDAVEMAKINIRNGGQGLPEFTE